MKIETTVFLLLLGLSTVFANLDSNQIRCSVCEATVRELESIMSKVDPKLTIDVSGYRLDPSGNTKTKTLPQVKSEIFISEQMEKVCEKMDDYARARWKSNGQLTVIRLMTAEGTMNSDISNVDLVQDEDLNKSLKYYCHGILDDHEEIFIEHFKNNSNNKEKKICTEEAKLCSPSDEDENQEHDGFDDEL